jgi:hypothetical protein
MRVPVWQREMVASGMPQRRRHKLTHLKAKFETSFRHRKKGCNRNHALSSYGSTHLKAKFETSFFTS